MFRHTLSVAAVAALWLSIAPTSPALAQADGYDLYVSSRDNNSVKRYDGVTGAYLGDFVPSGSGGLALTQEVAFGPDGRLYVSGRGTSAILVYDPRTGAFLGEFTSGYTLDEPTKMTFGPDGMLYVSQWGQSKSSVARFDAQTGEFIDEATGNLNDPMGHAWDADGNLYVIGFGSRDVRRYTPDGEFIDVFVSSFNLEGPVNLWFAGDALFIIDWQRGAVLEYDGATGAYRSTLVTGMTRAEGWTYDPSGRLYVADWADDVVDQYNAETGEFLGVFVSSGGLSTPNSIAFGERFPDFRLDAPAEDLLLEAGASVTTTIAVDPDRDLAFDEPVVLSCSGLPGGAACSFTPTEVIPGAGGASAELTITSPVPSSAATVAAAALAGVFLLLLAAGRRRAIPARGWSGFGAALFVLAVMSTCGTERPPPTSVRVTITGTAGDLVHSTTVDLLVDGL